MFAQHRFVIGILVALALALAAVAPVAALAADDDPPPPAITGVTVTDVTATTATLHAQVDTSDGPTTAHFAYGTDQNQRNLQTPDQDLGTGGVVPLTATLTGLTPGTTYSYTVVFESEHWVGAGGGSEFQTLSAPSPEILGSAVDGITYKSATLHLHVATHGQPATVSGAAGTARIPAFAPLVPSLGASVSFRSVPVPPDGDVAIPLTGLAAGKTYYWAAAPDRALPGGAIPRSTANGSFATVPLLPVARPALSAVKVAYGTHVTISGTVPKPGVLVTLVQAAPLTGRIAPTAVTTTADGSGAYAFDVRAGRSARYGVAFDGAARVTPAGLARLDVLPAITARLQRAKGHRFRVTGSYAPHVGAQVSLFRRGAGRVAEKRSEGAFRFAARTLRPGTYEVRVTPDSRPELIAGKSATFTVPRR
jgi:hypothetical protein